MLLVETLRQLLDFGARLCLPIDVQLDDLSFVCLPQGSVPMVTLTWPMGRNLKD